MNLEIYKTILKSKKKTKIFVFTNLKFNLNWNLEIFNL